MNPQIKKRLVRTALFSLIALVIGVGVGWMQIQMQAARVTTKEGKPAETAMPVAGLSFGGPFSLIDHTGAQVSEKTYEGKYKLIYFGFTYCPAICPTELQKMSRVLSALEKNHPEALENVQPLFISVDPERDTLDVMREYIGLFHPQLVGLTGTTAQIDLIKKRYRVFASKVEDETNQDYTVDHSSFTYLMGPNDELIGMYRMKDTADQIYQDLIKRLGL
ncbi:MAG: SCO family protein [Alphaproteobacteria bacterium]|nr:SCO family protein [Alphaproteobacteria bacterium]